MIYPSLVSNFYTFIDGNVQHRVDLSMKVRNRFGSKIGKLWFAGCVNYAQKTCSTSAFSTGLTYIFVTLIAEEVHPYTAPDGKKFIEFVLDVKLTGVSNSSTYSPMSVSVGF